MLRGRAALKAIALLDRDLRFGLEPCPQAPALRRRWRSFARLAAVQAIGHVRLAWCWQSTARLLVSIVLFAELAAFAALRQRVQPLLGIAGVVDDQASIDVALLSGSPFPPFATFSSILFFADMRAIVLGCPARRRPAAWLPLLRAPALSPRCPVRLGAVRVPDPLQPLDSPHRVFVSALRDPLASLLISRPLVLRCARAF